MATAKVRAITRDEIARYRVRTVGKLRLPARLRQARYVMQVTQNALQQIAMWDCLETKPCEDVHRSVKSYCAACAAREALKQWKLLV